MSDDGNSKVGALALAFGMIGRLDHAARLKLQEAYRRQDLVVRALTVGMTDVEQQLVERPDEDVQFLLKAHILGIDRKTAERILADVPRPMADWTLEQFAYRPRDFPNPGIDWAFGPGATARLSAERAGRDRREAVESGRRHEGDRSTWYASITWSRRAWFALHGYREPKRWDR